MAKRKSKNYPSYTYKREKRRVPRSLGLAEHTKRGVAAVVLVTLAAIFALSVLGLAGSLGRWLVRLLTTLFGVIGYTAPLFLAVAAYEVLKTKTDVELPKGKENTETDLPPPANTTLRVVLGAGLIWLALSGALSLGVSPENVWQTVSSASGGGLVGAVVAGILLRLIGTAAAWFVLAAVFIIGSLIIGNWRLVWPHRKIDPAVTAGKPETVVAFPDNLPKAEFATKTLGGDSASAKSEPVNQPTAAIKSSVATTDSKPKKPEEFMDIKAPRTTPEEWHLPGFDLLEKQGKGADSGNVEAGGAIIQQTLKNFGIEVEMGETCVGPTVTQYTLRPATGVKLSQIAALKSDLALALAAKSFRMELPIPGKALVGVEVPNRSTALVALRSVLETSEFINFSSPLCIALGVDVAGRPQLVDLAKLPHLLIAGATGSGKSVGINTLIISLLYRNSPRAVKFILIDPKRVELNLYQGLPHLVTPPITEPEKAVNSLRWAVAEMERRYEQLASMSKRNIVEFNSVASDPLPYIVIIVDELADLMAVAQSDMEAVVVRLAQMARAVGIHLVLATQRPSVDVLTGLIKANITARSAYAVASQIDSRTILDSSGAEQLLGNGDMLFISADQSKPRRVQGAFVGEAEVRRVVNFCKRQVGAVVYDDSVTERGKQAGANGGMNFDGEEDELFEAAKEEVLRAGKASASFLQRRLRIGYSRAARLLDLLENAGVIGPADGAKPREVYENSQGSAASAADEAEMNEAQAAEQEKSSPVLDEKQEE